MVDPILKWAGGKRQILAQIKGHFPPEEEIRRYHEPFFGGGAVFFKECHHLADSINDINSLLMNYYRQVKGNPKELITTLEDFTGPKEPTDPSDEFSDEKNYYYQQRKKFNKRPRDQDFDELEEAALLQYLNVTCFNGLYRENQSGEFNVPCGSHETHDWVRASRIKQASEALEGTSIFNTDFSYILERAEPGDLVYFDPPYDPDSDSSTFSEYSMDAFGKEEQVRLRDIAVQLNEREVRVVISNAPSIKEKYEPFTAEGFRIHPVGANRVINSNGSDRGEVKEVIITNVQRQRERDTQLADFSQ
jgi:DNA adenine methylase